ncbi:MAG: hypothetical protein JSR28_12565 [Proteobacteria bacterium]|nr:hypothetical protein [Pseudomonadota bacterium]
MLTALQLAIATGALILVAALVHAAGRNRARPSGEGLLIGAVTDFFDAPGIGSFAPAMAWFAFRRLVPDAIIPQTLIVGHSIPGFVQALILLTLLGVSVGPLLLISCALATAIGGVPAVLVAAFLVKAMPIAMLRWLVAGVVIHAAMVMFRSTLQRQAA